MIIKSSQRAAPKQLAAHLTKEVDIEGGPQTVEVTGSRHLIRGDDVFISLDDMDIMAKLAPRCSKHLYHVSASPSQEMSAAEWERFWEIYEQEFGLQHQPQIEVTHNHLNDDLPPHQHRVFERVDTVAGKAIELSFTKIRNEKVARIAEMELGHPITIGKHNQAVIKQLRQDGREDVATWMEQQLAHTSERPAADKSHADHQQEKRTGIPIDQVKADLTDAWNRTDNGSSFEALIAEQGYLLCKGTRRDFVIVDTTGNVHSPRRRIAGVKAKDIRERWSDLDPKTLLTVGEAQSAREAFWAAEQERQAAADVEALRQEMTASERLAEQQLLADIAALQAQLYEEFQHQSLGAETHASTVRLGLLPQDFEQWQAHYQLIAQGNTQLGPDTAFGHPDQRLLIETLQHWQRKAADPERRLPQAVAGHGSQRTGNTRDDDGNDTVIPGQSLTPVEPVTAWGLSPSIVMLIQTYDGQQAIAERERRIDAALNATSDADRQPDPKAEQGEPGASNTTINPNGEHQKTVHQTADGADAGEVSALIDKKAAAVYLRELGQHLRDRGRGAYAQADRWLAERLAKRGYSRQETRRVIAHSSPALMEQAPGQRVSFIRRTVERVYRRREHWQERLATKTKQNNTNSQKKTLADGQPKSPRTVVVPKAPARPVIKTQKPRRQPSSTAKTKGNSRLKRRQQDREPEL